MRMSFEVYFEQDNFPIPPDYRRYILSLFKEGLLQEGEESKEFFHKNFDKNSIKPFTFSTYIPFKRGSEGMVLGRNFIKIFFSTSDYDYLIRSYNGLNKLNEKLKNKKNQSNLESLSGKESFKLFDKSFVMKNFKLLPVRKIESEQVTFKTLSPFILRSLEDGDYYIVPEGLTSKDFKYKKEVDMQYFKKAMRLNIASLCRRYLSIDENAAKSRMLESFNGEIQIDFENLSIAPVKHGSNNPEHPYDITLPALNGFIKIKAPEAILQLVYDIGIGARRSEGFGMLEVVD
ncbi:MAG TPA: CRISPR-associated endoribonuclease Cas6 [Exilispira sp.]|nr:CRISPR-associated endoribonuclease Cas6 [Exilispira sp.]